MATWVLGDVHGCADELARLIERIAPAPGERLVCCGDLLHRGPDPLGVIELLRERGALFVLGNHERAILRRLGLAPEELEAEPARAAPPGLPPLGPEHVAGDGGTPLAVPAERRADVVRFLLGHSGHLLRHERIEGAGPTPDGRPWVVVHAGLDPGAGLASSIAAVTTIRRLEGGHRPWWYEHWRGPELVLFGHTSSPVPRAQRAGTRLVALGLDTGCVYGGRLSAYSPELDRLVSVPAARDQRR